jgi:hypothetical protein
VHFAFERCVKQKKVSTENSKFGTVRYILLIEREKSQLALVLLFCAPLQKNYLDSTQWFIEEIKLKVLFYIHPPSFTSKVFLFIWVLFSITCLYALGVVA